MPALTQVILYVKALDDVAAFYCGVFGYARRDRPGDRIVELQPPGGGGYAFANAKDPAGSSVQVTSRP